MQPTKVACPLCSSISIVQDSPPFGRTVTCQQCLMPFMVGPEEIKRAQQTAPPGQASPSPAADGWWVQPKPVPVVANPTPKPSSAALRTPPPGKLVSATAAKPKAKIAPLKCDAAPVQVESRAGLGALIAGGLVALGLLFLLGIGSVLAFVCFFAGGDKESEVTEAPDVQQRPTASPRKLTPLMERQQRAQAESPPTPPAEEPRKIDDNPPAKDPAPRQQEPVKGEEKPDAPPPPAKPQNPPMQEVQSPQPPAPDKSMVAAAFQKKIDEAIERGSKFLVNAQLPDGSWQEHGHTLGTTALPALTLLECGTSPRDPRIAASADFVRKHWADNKATYEIALAILFLDKLLERKQAEKKTGAKKDELIATDKQIIQALALRLIAGQTPNGGWDYDCPVLTNPQATNLLTALKQNRPKALPTAVEKPDKSNMPTPVDKGDKGPLPAPVDKSKSGDAPGKVLPPDGMSFLNPDLEPASGLGGSPPERMLHQALRLVPAAAQPPPKGPKDMKGIKMMSDRDDNSNTQFGMMALWAARRHDIPVEAAMLTVEQRFRVSQLPDGGWAYHFKEVRPKASMTCVGLIGIALGKGASAEMTMRANKNKAPAKKLPMDRMIRDGLSFLGPNLENRKVENHVWPSGLSLYFMWSVERVAVLYDLRLIEGKDWYRWGSQILLDAQRVNGSWETHSYAGANSTCDTSFALLFLKRVNLVQDLTDLQLYMAVPETQGPQPKNP